MSERYYIQNLPNTFSDDRFPQRDDYIFCEVCGSKAKFNTDKMSFTCPIGHKVIALPKKLKQDFANEDSVYWLKNYQQNKEGTKE